MESETIARADAYQFSGRCSGPLSAMKRPDWLGSTNVNRTGGDLAHLRPLIAAGRSRRLSCNQRLAPPRFLFQPGEHVPERVQQDVAVQERDRVSGPLVELLQLEVEHGHERVLGRPQREVRRADLERTEDAGERRVATEIRDDLSVSELVRSELRFVLEKASGG